MYFRRKQGFEDLRSNGLLFFLFIHIIRFEPRNETRASVAELALPPHNRKYVFSAQAGVRRPEIQRTAVFSQ
jgi:hypothetical protein